MAAPKFNRERASRMLTEASLSGDKATAKKYGMSVRSLQRWRVKLSSDTELSQAVAVKREIVEKAWADGIGEALRDGIAFLRRAFAEANPSDPEAIHAVAGAFKLLSEADTTQKVLGVRLAREARPPGTQHRQMAAGGVADAVIVQ